MVFGEPATVIAVHLIAVQGAQAHVLEVVIGQFDVMVGPVDPIGRPLVVVVGADAAIAIGVDEVVGWAGAGARILPHDLRRQALEILQVPLAKQGGAIAGIAQQADEGGGAERERDAVMAHAVDRGHTPGHQRGAVGHAHRTGNVSAIEAGAAGGDGVDMRGLVDGVAVATEMVGALLIGDEQQEVGAGWHGGRVTNSAFAGNARDRSTAKAAFSIVGSHTLTLISSSPHPNPLPQGERGLWVARRNSLSPLVGEG